jgi:hypothetical protein
MSHTPTAKDHDRNGCADCERAAEDAMGVVMAVIPDWDRVFGPGPEGVYWIHLGVDKPMIGISDPWINAPGFHDDPGHWLICVYRSADSDEILAEYTGTDNNEAAAFVRKHITV